MTCDPGHGTALRAAAASWTSCSLTQAPRSRQVRGERVSVRPSCRRLAQRSHATPQTPLPTAMFPGGSVSHPQGAEDKGDDEHADAGKSRYSRPCTTTPRTPSAMAAITRSRNKIIIGSPAECTCRYILTTACTLQGMARVRSGRGAAWPLVSGLNVPLGSRIKCDVGNVDCRSAHSHRMAEPRLAGNHPARMS